MIRIRKRIHGLNADYTDYLRDKHAFYAEDKRPNVTERGYKANDSPLVPQVRAAARRHKNPKITAIFFVCPHDPCNPRNPWIKYPS